MSLHSGTILENRYRVDSLLGQGGMGAVYRAWDQRLAVWVALKENRLSSPEAHAQFVREAQVLARLHHSNLPKVMDHFITPDGLQYLVMTFIEGINLADLLASRGRQSPAEVASWLEQVCDALTYLHSQNPPIIHRDIKPQNIKVTPDGRVFLVDFGLSKVGSIYQSTASGALGVTPGFSPWEQYGQGHTDQRSDVYALTATLYAMLTGEIPPDSVRRGLAGVPLRSPREFNPGLSPALERTLVRGLETQPTNRPASVAALRQELEAGLALPNRAAPAPRPPAALSIRDVSRPSSAPVASSTRRERGLPWWALIGVGVVAVVIVVIGVAAIGGRGTSTATSSAVAVNTRSPADARTAQPAGATLAAPLALATLLTPTSTPPPTATPLPTSTPSATPLPSATPTATPTAQACRIATGDAFRSLWQQQRTRLGCPLNQAALRGAAAERFERGRMIWRENNDMIYVLNDNGDWAVYADIYVEGAPEPDGFQPPAGLHTPVRGFGAIWRTKLGGTSARIGWATQDEYAAPALFQDFEKGLMLEMEGKAYLLGDNGGHWQAP